MDARDFMLDDTILADGVPSKVTYLDRWGVIHYQRIDNSKDLDGGEIAGLKVSDEVLDHVGLKYVEEEHVWMNEDESMFLWVEAPGIAHLRLYKEETSVEKPISYLHELQHECKNNGLKAIVYK